MNLELSRSDCLHIFKACEDRRAKLHSLQRASDDEDVVADAGNDLLEIGMIIRRLKADADALWGAERWTTSNEYL